MTSELVHHGQSFDDQPLGFGTKSIHLGNGVDKETGAIRRPITLANAYALPYDPSDINWSSSDVNLYTRNGHPNQRYLEAKLANLEGAEDAVVLASGVAALAATFTTFLNRGDHAIFSDTTYIAAYRLINQILPEKYGIETSIVDTSDPANVLNAIKPNTKLIHLETPANPTLKVTDIASVTSIAREAQERLGHDILVSVDNTFNSPYNVRPLELGADIVVESLTKYINGHGDALGGMIATTKARTDEIRFTAQVNYGGIISPFNAWVLLQGTETLSLRLDRHNENTKKVVEFLTHHPKVEKVNHPSLPDHPDHALYEKYFPNGGASIFTFNIKGGQKEAFEFIDHLQIFSLLANVADVKSLVIHPATTTHGQLSDAELADVGIGRNTIRLSIGTEHVDDIIADLAQALDAVE